MEKRKVIFIIILINLLIGLYSTSYAGLYNIEVPLTITDDVFFSNSLDVNRQLMELVNNNLKDTNEEIAVVVFTRSGEPVRPLIDNSTSMIKKTDIPNIDKTLEDNDIEFLWVNDPPNNWDQQQIDDMIWFLRDVEADDGFARGIYNCSKKLYGPPFFDSDENNYKVELYLDPGLPENVKAVWIPPTNWADWSDIGHGKLYLRYYPDDPLNDHEPADDYARKVLAKAMLMLFWGSFL